MPAILIDEGGGGVCYWMGGVSNRMGVDFKAPAASCQALYRKKNCVIYCNRVLSARTLEIGSPALRT